MGRWAICGAEETDALALRQVHTRAAVRARATGIWESPASSFFLRVLRNLLPTCSDPLGLSDLSRSSKALSTCGCMR
jgi:hypothetical protein